MKKKYLFLFMLFFALGCKVSVKENTDSIEQPDYEDFSETQTSEKTQTANNKFFNLSTELNDFLASSEQVVIFSFKTKNGKTLSLLTDKNENYLIYRFGTPQNVTLTFPKTVDKNSWKKFSYEAYKTSVVNLMHISFTNVNHKYTVYYNKFANTPEDNKIGVQVQSLETGKIDDIRGVLSSVNGNLNYFKTNNKVDFFE